MRKTSVAVCVAMLIPVASLAQTSPDERLARPVTLSETGTDLGRLAKTLTRLTGVSVRVENDIAAEKVDVFVKDYPLGALQKRLSRLFSYDWYTKPDADGKPIYVLRRDGETRKWQEDLRGGVSRRQVAARKEAVAGLKGILSMSREEVRQLPRERMEWADKLRFGSQGTVTRLFSDLTPAQVDTLLTRGRLTVAFADRPPGFREGLLKDLLDDMGLDTQAFAFTAGVDLIASPRWRPGMKNHPDMLYLFLRGENGASLWRGCPLTPQAELAVAPLRPDKPETDEMDRFKPDPTDMAKPDERLDMTVKAEAGTRVDFHDGLRRIAEATGIPILSDWYATPIGPVTLREQKAGDLLAALTARFGHRKATDDGALLFREDGWPALMEREVPLDTLEALAREGKPGALNLSQSFLAIRLPDPQLENLALHGYVPGWLADAAITRAIAFLAALTPAHVKAIQSPDGLAAASMPAGARDAFQAFLAERGGSPGPVRSLRLRYEADSTRGPNALTEVTLQMEPVANDVPIQETRFFLGPDKAG